jgi:3-polyprenyl-4-hydroxybenzoate decarboxylase
VCRACLSMLCLSLLFTACGESTVRPEGAERSVVDVVSRKTDFRPKDVRCPSDVEAEVGGTFECEFTGPEGPYVAHMEIVEVDGERVVYQVTTRPLGS